jgi:hypothetical protein
VTQPDGKPKSSVYLSIYNVLARIPVSAIGKLYLVTDDGRTLELRSADYTPGSASIRCICIRSSAPITRWSRADWSRKRSAARSPTRRPVNLPRIAFSELKLGELAFDPG